MAVNLDDETKAVGRNLVHAGILIQQNPTPTLNEYRTFVQILQECTETLNNIRELREDCDA